VFRQRKVVEPFRYCRLHDILKCVLRMAAELARMTVMGVRHADLDERKWWPSKVLARAAIPIKFTNE
jgi:hypothetical protein